MQFRILRVGTLYLVLLLLSGCFFIRTKPRRVACCPSCYNPPTLAIIDRDTRRRYLWCECGTRWRFPRLKCPFCGTENQEQLGYYHTDGGWFRLYVCDHCKRYIKAVDETRVPYTTTFDMDLINKFTDELDSLAIHRGYH